MDQRSNVQFSRQELDLMRDDRIFPQKQRITKKIYDLFYELSLALKNHSITQTYPFPEGTDVTAGKISKGESYQEQPYAILDLPRKFSRRVILAYRTMFWWGHCFCFTLHVAGAPAKDAMQRFLENYSQLRGQDVFFCVNDNQFEHHFGEDNYQPLDELDQPTIRQHIEERHFVKVTKQLPLTEWDHVIEESVKNYELMMAVIR